jgi:TRAP-type C4-dicarboxylate transport system permease small subunit
MSSTASVSGKWARTSDLVHKFITAWALLGGLVLVFAILVNVGSILAGAIINKPFPGDFELTELSVAVAAFCFLPYCQLIGANVSADIFTVNAGRIKIAAMRLLSSLIAVTFSVLLTWRMTVGLQDYIEYEEITGILSIPLWWAFIPAVISLVLLTIAAVVSLINSLSELRKVS